MPDTLWDRLLASLEGHLPPQALANWIRPARLLGYHDNRLELAVPNKFARQYIEQHYLATLQAAAANLLGARTHVVLTIDRSLPAAPPPTPVPAPAAPAAAALDARYTFETFVVGSSNQFAQAACLAVAEHPSAAYNPLFIYGGVGLGKTHLLHAIGHRLTHSHPQIRVQYLSSEKFTNELIGAIRYDKTPEFRQRYRTMDLLLIDDVQFLSGKERTQEEFFHTFNDLHESRRQIVLSSDRSPKEIPEVEERLRSRFEWGLIADIQPPDFETRVAILNKRAELERVRLPDEAAYLIASRIKANIREIEGSLTRMIAFCSLSGREMSVDLAQDVLAELWGEEEKVITIEHIQQKTADFFSIKLSDMRAKTRTKAVAFPRQIPKYLARQLTHA